MSRRWRRCCSNWWRTVFFFSGSKLDTRKLDLEDQCSIGRDSRWRAIGAVRQMRRYHQHSSTALLHANQTLIPAFDDLTGADSDTECLGVIHVGVEHIARLAIGLDPAAILDTGSVAASEGASFFGHNQLLHNQLVINGTGFGSGNMDCKRVCSFGRCKLQ
jgi:hypothetical protein